MSEVAPKLYGYLAEFDHPDLLIEGCEKVRDAGFRRWDAFTPFPVHGMDKAMGIRGTQLPWFVLACGLSGLGLALLMQWWMNAVDYPFAISGKPFFGLPAAMPIVFELTVLLSAFGTFFGMWGRNGMPKLYHPLFKSERFRRVTSDRFFIAVEASDPKFDAEKTRVLLESLGGVAVERVED